VTLNYVKINYTEENRMVITPDITVKIMGNWGWITRSVTRKWE
jgi:hypothetical protein